MEVESLQSMSARQILDERLLPSSIRIEKCDRCENRILKTEPCYFCKIVPKNLSVKIQKLNSLKQNPTVYAVILAYLKKSWESGLIPDFYQEMDEQFRRDFDFIYFCDEKNVPDLLNRKELENSYSEFFTFLKKIGNTNVTVSAYEDIRTTHMEVNVFGFCDWKTLDAEYKKKKDWDDKHYYYIKGYDPIYLNNYCCEIPDNSSLEIFKNWIMTYPIQGLVADAYLPHFGVYSDLHMKWEKLMEKYQPVKFDFKTARNIIDVNLIKNYKDYENAIVTKKQYVQYFTNILNLHNDGETAINVKSLNRDNLIYFKNNAKFKILSGRFDELPFF